MRKWVDHGATATVASILVHRWNPTVITFDQPIAADPGCMFIPSQRMFRYINFVATERDGAGNTDGNAVVDMEVDLVVILPAGFSGSVHYGHFIAVRPDPQAVRFYGTDDNFTFLGSSEDGGIMPHAIVIGDHSYRARIAALLVSAQQGSPISALGFSPGTLCEPRPLSDVCSKRCDPIDEQPFELVACLGHFVHIRIALMNYSRLPPRQWLALPQHPHILRVGVGVPQAPFGGDGRDFFVFRQPAWHRGSTWSSAD
jgi:hypothetical protein